MDKWGDHKAMRRAYHKKCLEYHPDKGGDEEKMKRLNCLYKMLTKETMTFSDSSQRWSWSTTEVGGDLYCFVWGYCNHSANPSCRNKCLMCTLRKCHMIRAKYKPLRWRVCYCYECFRRFFGIGNSLEALDVWRSIVAVTPFSELQVF